LLKLDVEQLKEAVATASSTTLKPAQDTAERRQVTVYDPVEHRALATRFGQDVRMALLPFRSLALWILGYPDRALADAGR
jgi:hypothetical protein